jgi:ribosomal protein S18 acetylase RimI-like enzyme
MAVLAHGLFIEVTVTARHKAASGRAPAACPPELTRSLAAAGASMGPVPSYRVRPATADDVGFLADVVIEATLAQGRLPDGFDERQWRESFTQWTLKQVRSQDADRTTSVIEVGNERAGRLRITRDASGIELSGIQLLPGFQRRGIGTAVVEDLKAQATAAGVPLHLGVEKDNPGARRLYERLGFRHAGEDDQEDKLRWDPRPAE